MVRVPPAGRRSSAAFVAPEMQHYLCGAELGCLSSCIKKKCIKEKRWLTSASGSWAAACGSRLQIWQLVRVCDQVVGTIGAG